MKKKTKDNIGCFLWCLFYLIIIIVGAYISYIEWSNTFFLIGSFIEWVIVSLAITYGKIVGYRNGVEDTREICYPVLQELKDEVDKCHNCKHYKEKNK